MSRPGVSYEEVELAALTMQREGKVPTIESVRMRLGTGSNSTIQSHLQRLKAQQQNRSLLPSSPDLLPPDLAGLVNQLWQALQDNAHQQMKEMMLAHQHAQEQLHSQMQKYRESNRRWQTMHDTWAKEKETYLADITLGNQTAVKMKESIVSLEIATTLLNKELDEKNYRINELNQLHNRAQENLEHFRELTQQQRRLHEEETQQRLLKLDSEIHQHKKDNVQLQQEIIKSRETMNYQRGFMEKQNEMLRDKANLLEKSEIQHTFHLEELHQLRVELESSKVKLHRQNNNLTELTARNAQLETMLTSLNETLSKSLLEKAVMQGKLTQLENLLAQSRHYLLTE
jgi:hypothetical protein